MSSTKSPDPQRHLFGISMRQFSTSSIVQKEQKDRCKLAYDISPLDSEYIFDIQLVMARGADHVRVRAADAHTNVVLIEKNGGSIFAHPRPGHGGRRAGRKNERL